MPISAVSLGLYWSPPKAARHGLMLPHAMAVTNRAIRGKNVDLWPIAGTHVPVKAISATL